MIKNSNSYGLIMAGGIGSRFWPISTPEKPKQFLDVLGLGKSLLQITYERLILTIPKENIYILTNKKYSEIVIDQLPELTKDQILAEPERKNTAPCIAFASAKIHAINPNANLVISPSDHLIINSSKFSTQLQIAIDESQKDKLVVLGIKPTRPDTGYGYIEFDNKEGGVATDVVSVSQFCEKPKLEKAQEFVSKGNFYWNAGIFVVGTKTISDLFLKYEIDLYNLFFKNSNEYWAEQEDIFVKKAFSESENISFDYAIMEKAENTSMVLTDFDWSDLGSWGSIKDHASSDDKKMALINGNINYFDSENCLLYGQANKTYLIEGLNNHILIDSEDKLLLIPFENEGALKSRLKTIGEKI